MTTREFPVEREREKETEKQTPRDFDENWKVMDERKKRKTRGIFFLLVSIGKMMKKCDTNQGKCQTHGKSYRDKESYKGLQLERVRVVIPAEFNLIHTCISCPSSLTLQSVSGNDRPFHFFCLERMMIIMAFVLSSDVSFGSCFRTKTGNTLGCSNNSNEREGGGDKNLVTIFSFFVIPGKTKRSTKRIN